MSTQTNNSKSTSSGSSRHQICIAIVMFIVLTLTPGTSGRSDLGALIMRQDLPQLYLDEWLAAANEDASLYAELKKYQRNQLPPHINAKWPGLRDLLQTADYDDGQLDASNDAIANTHFLERLRQLATNNVDMEEVERAENVLDSGVNNESLPTPVTLKKMAPLAVAGSKMGFKEHGSKKNAQYMSPCHFKICNMGRKRNARFFSYNNN